CSITGMTARGAALARWPGRGVRGARITVSPIRKPEAGLADALRPKIVRTAEICGELGWHVDLLLPGWLVSELMPTLGERRVGLRVAHMGLFPPCEGPSQQGFRDFLALVGDGSARCWVKLTGIYRFSQAAGYADVKPFAEALIATALEQMIWGSDFPHLSFHDKVGTIELYNKLMDWAPDAATRQRILADNPARLFEFSAVCRQAMDSPEVQGPWKSCRSLGGIQICCFSPPVVGLVGRGEEGARLGLATPS